MREVVVKMLIEFGNSQESVDFLYSVPDDWEYSEESVAPIYAAFRSDAVLNVEDVECDECGFSLGQCECGEEDDDE